MRPPKKSPEEHLDYLTEAEKRKFQRFRSTAFLGIPLILKAVPPFFGEPIEGQVVDLSGGGMAILIRDALPSNTKMKMELIFPNKTKIGCLVMVRRVSACVGGHLTGIQFLDMPNEMSAKIDGMSNDCNACDGRILEKEEVEICQPECRFMSICDKPQKKDPSKLANHSIEMKLKPLE